MQTTETGSAYNSKRLRYSLFTDGQRGSYKRHPFSSSQPAEEMQLVHFAPSPSTQGRKLPKANHTPHTIPKPDLNALSLPPFSPLIYTILCTSWHRNIKISSSDVHRPVEMTVSSHRDPPQRRPTSIMYINRTESDYSLLPNHC